MNAQPASAVVPRAPVSLRVCESLLQCLNLASLQDTGRKACGNVVPAQKRRISAKLCEKAFGERGVSRGCPGEGQFAQGPVFREVREGPG